VKPFFPEKRMEKKVNAEALIALEQPLLKVRSFNV
jgi:hypothetical protein